MRRRWRLTAVTALVGAGMYVPLAYLARVVACDPAAPLRCEVAHPFDKAVVLVMVVFAGSIPALVALSAPAPADPTARALVIVLLLVVGILATFLVAGVDYRGCKREPSGPVVGCQSAGAGQDSLLA